MTTTDVGRSTDGPILPLSPLPLTPLYEATRRAFRPTPDADRPAPTTAPTYGQELPYAEPTWAAPDPATVWTDERPPAAAARPRVGAGLARDLLVKVPAVTLGFWVVKVIATTLGETGGDALSMSLGLGYLVSTLIFAALFAVMVAVQVRATRFNAWVYWGTIVATTTVGTTIADMVDRDLGLGYPSGVALLLCAVGAALLTWRLVVGTVDITRDSGPVAQTFYWLTILCSQTLGTALGDWTADTIGLDYTGGAFVFAFLLGVIAILYFVTDLNRVALFWAAFVLTRPLGAVVGDFIDKPTEDGGLELDRFAASATLLVAMVVLILVTRPRAARRAH